LSEIGSDEDRVNQLHIEIDDLCLRLIALHQPAAGDLRLIAAALKINSDLERIADQAVNIAETSSFLSRAPKMHLGDIPRMVELAVSMVKDALDAFARRDVDLARDVIARDDEEDQLKSQTFNELIQLMQSDASTIQRGMDIILIARNLERIADHATNIAEDVVFMVLGKDIRHGAEKTAQAEA
jgi:phosphate transport system protein